MTKSKKFNNPALIRKKITILILKDEEESFNKLTNGFKEFSLSGYEKSNNFAGLHAGLNREFLKISLISNKSNNL